MKHYFTRLEESIKANWERPALGNYRGELFTFGELATQIAKFYVFFEAIGLKKGDKVALCANDIDNDRVYVKYFDLKLKKDLVKIIITEDGKTRELNITDTNSLHKVEIHRKKLKTTVVKFVYNITVTNEGEIAGYVTELKDYIPEGLEFISEENRQWTKISDSIITTNALSEKLLEPGKSETVSVTLKWKNDENNLGMKTNIAEISKDKNGSGTPDIDSIPDNKKDGEDDIDKAEVMLTISTGIAQPKYLWLTTTVLAIWTVGIILIKKYVL